MGRLYSTSSTRRASFPFVPLLSLLSHLHHLPLTQVTMNQHGALIKLFNQRRVALLSQEFLELRDATIGPQPLRVLFETGFPIEALPALSSGAAEDFDTHKMINEYVTQLALGDAICRHRGELPPETCVPNGALEELKGIPPFWTALFSYVEEERMKGGSLADDPAWAKDYVKGKTWTKRLEATLSQLDAQFCECTPPCMRSSRGHSSSSQRLTFVTCSQSGAECVHRKRDVWQQSSRRLVGRRLRGSSCYSPAARAAPRSSCHLLSRRRAYSRLSRGAAAKRGFRVESARPPRA